MKRGIQTAVIVTVVLLIGILVFYRKNPNGELKRYQASFLDVFDTQTEIIGYDTSQEAFTRKVGLIKDRLKYYNDLYDIYHNYDGINNIKTINDNAGVQPVRVDAEIIELLKLSIAMNEKTEGKINVAFGSVLSIWHNYREAGIEDPESAELPPMDMLREANRHTGVEGIEMDEAASTVYLPDPLMSLDVGGIGKGFAVQRVVDYAKEELGITNLLLSVGGNVSGIGGRPDGTPWRLGIQNPDTQSEDAYIRKVDIMDQCVVTSGNYQRYYTVDQVRYCHIIEPDTLMPADYFASVSVVTPDSGIADAYSTSLYNMDYEDGLAFVEGEDDVEAMWVFEDGTVKYSSGFEDYLVKDN